MKKIFSSLLAAAMVFTLAGCNGSSGTASVYNDYELTKNEMESFNYLNSAQSKDLQVLANFVDGLLEHNAAGELVPALAESWDHNEDTTVWTFTLRDGLKWIDNTGTEVADVTTEDFITGMRYILTADNQSGNTSMPMQMIAGAAEYYQATLDGADQATLDSLWENVGIKAVDDKTLEYTMVGPTPYFDTVTTYNAFFPAPTDFLAEQGANFGTSMDTILYCGCYYMTQYENNSLKVYTKNPSYWDAKNVPFETVNVSMLESQERAFDMFENGELDRALLTQAQIQTQTEAGDDRLVETREGQHVYSLYFNYEVDSSLEGADDWNAAVRNENFRKAWYYGLDFTKQVQTTNPYSYESMMSNTFTADSLCWNSEGTDYTKVGALAEYNTDESQARLDADLFQQYKETAMSELQAQGVTFPVKVYYAYQSGAQAEEDKFAITKSSFEECLGTDFIEVVGQPYTRNSRSEVYLVNKHSVTVAGWGADYGDPYNFLVQLTTLEGNYMNSQYSHMSDPTFDQMIVEANAITDIDARYEAFAEAEAYALEHALIVPGYVNGVEWEVTRINDYSKPYAKYGVANRKIKYWEKQADAYTAEEYEALAAQAS